MEEIDSKKLLENITKLHTTDLGVIRIKRNLALNIDDIVEWCKQQILKANAKIIKKGKNYYVHINNCTITINAHSYTIITAHKNKQTKKLST